MFGQGNSNMTNYPQQNSTSSISEDIEIIDSEYNLLQALEGINIPYSIRKDLKLVTVRYYGFDDKLHQGQLIVNKRIAEEVKEIFILIRKIKFPIEKVIPLTEYNWSDEDSMGDNNTSAFNYRFISGSRVLSMHAKGLAIDINPKQNPYVKNGVITPQGALYNVEVKGTIKPGSKIIKIFKERGWTWGGDWKSLKDYQHFQKELE
jgi:hypothetical protein